MDRLEGLNSFLEYTDNNRLKCKDEKDIDHYFRHDINHNKGLGGKSFILGWSSIVLLEQKGTGLSVEKLFDLRYTISNDCLNKVFLQVVTNAVDSCTFVHIRIGRTHHLLAHLDSSDLEKGLNIIKEILSEYPLNKLFIFTSHIYSDKVLKFLNAIEILCNEGTRYTRHADYNFPDLNDREKVFDYYSKNRFGHMEIGLYINNGQVELFGDITNNNSCVEQKEVPTRCFSTMNELKNILPKEILPEEIT